MRLDELPRSDNIEDRRSEGGSTGGFGSPGVRGGLGIGTIVVLGLIGWALGIDPRLPIGGAELVSGGGSSYQQQDRTAAGSSGRTGTPSDQMGQWDCSMF
jgi:predicted metalloprotease